jgi:hypothetical protein
MGLFHARGRFDIFSVEVNVTQVVPMLGVTDMEASLRFYLDSVGFELTNKWTPEGKIRWCWLQLGGAALMLQEFKKKPEGKLGQGVSLNFQCKDSLAIYHVGHHPDGPRRLRAPLPQPHRPPRGNGIPAA